MAKKTGGGAPQRSAAQYVHPIAYTNRGRVGRPKIQGLIRDALDRDGMVFIQAQSRMGKTSIVELEAYEHKRRGVKISVLELKGENVQDVPAIIRDVALSFALHRTGKQDRHQQRSGYKQHDIKRSSSAHKQQHLLLIEDIPAGDELDAEKIAYELKRLLAQDIHIIATMDTSCELLIEEFKNIFVIRTHNLLVRASELEEWYGSSPQAGLSSLIAICHGMPALIEACRPLHKDASLDELIAQDSFLGELRTQANIALRQSCMAEERALRSAMLMLGHGSYVDLKALSLRVDPIVMEELARDAPLFGIDSRQERFSCVLAHSDAYEEVWEHIARFDAQLTQRAVELVRRRADYARVGALTAHFLNAGKRYSIALEYPIELIEAGKLRLVRDASKATRESVEIFQSYPFGAALSHICLGALDGDGERIRAALGEAPAVTNAAEREAQHRAALFCHAACLRKMNPQRWAEGPLYAFIRAWGGVQRDEQTELSTALAAHARVRSLMLDGHVLEAYRQLVTYSNHAHPESLTAALLCDDLSIARIIVGDPETTIDEQRRRKAGEFFSNAGLSDHLIYRQAAWEAAHIFAGVTHEFPSLERALACALRRGDYLTRGWFLTAAALADLRSGIIKRAFVRAQQAALLAHQCASQQLCVLASTFENLARLEAGEVLGAFQQKEQQDLSSRPMSALELVADLFDAQLAHDDARADSLSKRARDMECSVEAARLIDVLADLGSPYTENLNRLLPPSWVAQADALARKRKALLHEAELPKSKESFAETQHCHEPKALSPMLEISLLGSFTISLNGRLLTDNDWGRKKAPLILALVAVTRSHSLQRFQLVETLWPELDYARGQKSLYSTLSCLRKVLGDSVHAEHFIQTNSGSVYLNMEHVRCDVDEFERVAREVLVSQEDDDLLLGRCRKVEMLYRGDLYIPSQDGSGIFRMRHDACKRLYSDVMVLASQAALRKGLHREALWFAQDAHDERHVREDVTLCLLNALCATRRMSEAEAVYAEYARRVVEQTGLPPSKNMRQLFNELKAQDSRLAAQQHESLSTSTSIAPVVSNTIIQKREKNEQTQAEQEVNWRRAQVHAHMQQAGAADQEIHKHELLETG